MLALYAACLIVLLFYFFVLCACMNCFGFFFVFLFNPAWLVLIRCATPCEDALSIFLNWSHRTYPSCFPVSLVCQIRGNTLERFVVLLCIYILRLYWNIWIAWFPVKNSLIISYWLFMQHVSSYLLNTFVHVWAQLWWTQNNVSNKGCRKDDESDAVTKRK